MKPCSLLLSGNIYFFQIIHEKKYGITIPEARLIQWENSLEGALFRGVVEIKKRVALRRIDQHFETIVDFFRKGFCLHFEVTSMQAISC